LWSITKVLQIPLDEKIRHIQDIPHTISYVIRKNIQVDSLSELPSSKRPPDKMIWDGKPEDLEEWVANIYSTKKQNTVDFVISDEDIG